MATFQPTPTPMRQIPGAFITTPAPSRNDTTRRRLFNEPSSSFGSALAAPSPSQVQRIPAGSSALSGPDPNAQRQSNGSTAASSSNAIAPAPEGQLSPVAKASVSINQVLDSDASYPELDSYCRPGVSSDYDLPSNQPAWEPFQKVHQYPLPDQIFDRLSVGNLGVQLGLFSQIGHAWAYIDNALFLWDYSHPNPEIIGYEELTQVITAVALVPPKRGVFLEAITHVLVVATKSTVVLLGLAATSTPAGTTKVELYQTKMAVSISGSRVDTIAGTAKGRIFFGGNDDADVHELLYQQEEKWFTSRCSQINHSSRAWSTLLPDPTELLGKRKSNEHLEAIVVDDSRDLIYTLSDRSTIRTYHMEGPEQLTKVIEKVKTQTLRDASFLPQSPSPLLTDRMKIVSICPISGRESSRIYLMALTSTGCRLFLSATNASSYTYGGPTSRSSAPQSMQVQFIKFPPSEDARSRRYTDGSAEGLTDLNSHLLDYSIRGQRFAPGFFVDVVRRESNPGTDLIFVAAPDAGRIKYASPLSALKFFEHANWIDDGASERVLDVCLTSAPFAAGTTPLGFGNELAVQFDRPPSDIAILTNTGVRVIRRRRFVDIFGAVIRGAVGEEGLEKEMRRFTMLFGRVETVSAALAVACGQGSDLRAGTTRVVDQTTEDRARQAFIDYGGKPTVSESEGAQVTTSSVRLSARHDALTLYLGRLVRQLWRSEIARFAVGASGGLVISPKIPAAKLVAVQENVERLRRFLDSNRSTIQGLSGPADLQRMASRQDEIALQTEHQALFALQRLMESISEGISFVLMLFEERVVDIYARLDDDSRTGLRELKYESLFSQASGKNLAKVLVKAIVNRNIESGANVETVADALRRRCGSFCSPNDVVIFKAQEQLQRATEQTQNPVVLRTLLNESLRLFERVAGSLTSANLQSAVGQFVEVRYFAGAVQLCLVVAREKDRGNAALSWINDGRPAGDQRAQMFQERKRCYDLIHQILQKLDEVTGAEPEMLDGRPTLSATKRIEAYNVVNDSSDEVFHFDLYEWYITQSWTDRILAIESPHVITFLQRLASTDARHADLLCRFYTNRSRFFDAARVQADLARSDFQIGIKDRITLLSRAKGNASVTTTGVSRPDQQVLNHEVSELLEVAHIQDDLLERLKADRRIPPERKVEVERVLDGQILDLSDLFNNYADQAGYYDLCLLIYHAADYNNPRVVEDTWESLINNIHFEIQGRREAYNAHRIQQAVPDANGPAPPPQPYEAISAQVQTIAHRTSLDSLIFPIDALLPVVCRYAISDHQDAGIGADPAWPIILFLQLGVSHALVTRVLEQMHDAQEAPFTGRRRRVLVQWINVAVDSWVRDVERRGGGGGGGKGGDAAIGPWVVQLLQRAEGTVAQMLQTVRGAAEREELEITRRKTAALARDVESLVAAATATARLGFGL